MYSNTQFHVCVLVNMSMSVQLWRPVENKHIGECDQSWQLPPLPTPVSTDRLAEQRRQYWFRAELERYSKKNPVAHHYTFCRVFSVFSFAFGLQIYDEFKWMTAANTRNENTRQILPRAMVNKLGSQLLLLQWDWYSLSSPQMAPYASFNLNQLVVEQPLSS